MPETVLPISVCLIVLNEMDRLEACLKPLRGKFAEILIYDSGSTDGTVEYLRAQESITLIEGPWLGFSATRRAVWACAKAPWILWLDADEVLSAETLADLSRVGTEAGVGGYRLNRQIIFEGQRVRHGDWFPDWSLRVFPTDGWTLPERLVHESVEVAGEVRALRGVVDHHSFRNWADLERRSARYTELWAAQAAADKKRPGSPIFRAAWKFIRGYILKSGWLDGALGLRIALHNAREVFNKYTKYSR
jgi:glycosyltransferase involved in cell wall biosynthesis